MLSSGFSIVNRINTGEPRENKAPSFRDNGGWGGGGRYIGVLLHRFYYYRGEEYRSLYRELRHVEVPLYQQIERFNNDDLRLRQRRSHKVENAVAL